MGDATLEEQEREKSPDKTNEDLSVDAITEDLFGLNIRGLKSIFVSWVRPRDYFAAAKVHDWQDQFTPSLRLWLSFFALFSALKFWWLGTNEAMIGAFADGFANAGLNLPVGMTYQDVGSEAVLWVFGWIPIIQIITMIILSLIYNLWGERTTIALRQRYLFAVMIPSASVMPIFLTIMLFVPQSMITVYGILLALAAFFIDFQAGYRGAFSETSKGGRLWRAGLLAFILVTINTVTAIAVQIAGIMIIAGKYGAGLG